MSSAPHDWSGWFRHHAASDVGMRRGNNQDSFAVHLASDVEQWKRAGHLFLVADGMGAHAAGELASKLAVDHIPLIYQKHSDLSPPEGLERAFVGANLEIYRRGQENIDFHNMGTTCCALLVLPQGAVVGHVGDSRVYRLRGDVFSQLTFDHSLVWEMQSGNGKPPTDDSAVMPGIPKNVITRSLGPHSAVDVDLEGPFPVENGDTFLLCSDGLTGPLSDNEIATILRELDPEPAAQMLIDLANMHGGPDNITVAICKIVGDEIATQNRVDAPITVGDERKITREVPLGFWLASGVLALAGAAFLATQSIIPAVVAFALAIGTVLAALSIRMNVFGDGGVTLSGNEFLGKGPYRHLDRVSVGDFCKEMSVKLQAARVTVESRDWALDWSEFDRHRQAAEDFVASNQESDAVVSYSKAVNELVGQARQKLGSITDE